MVSTALTVISIAINRKRNTNKNRETIGNFINAGLSPESIKYSIAPRTAKKISVTLKYAGINFFIFYIFLKIILFDCRLMEFGSFRQSFLSCMKTPRYQVPQKRQRKSIMKVLDTPQLLQWF